MKLDRISTDATTPGICTMATHEASKANADTFAAATIFVGVWLDGLTLATCRKCGSSLAFDPDGWSDEPTEPMRNAMVKLL